MPETKEQMLKRVHDSSVPAAMNCIISPTFHAGGGQASILTVLETVICGVMCAIEEDPRVASFVLDEMINRVIERIQATHGKYAGAPTVWSIRPEQR